MSKYAVGGRTLATAATVNHVSAQLWNPHATMWISVHEVHFAQTAAVVSNLAVQRSSGRGATPTATVTPLDGNDFEKREAPLSGTVLELATFGTQPTLEDVPILRWNLPAAIGSGLMWVFPEPIKIGPGAGLCIATPVAVILQPGDATFVWDE